MTADQLNEMFQWASEEGHIEVVRMLLADDRVNPALYDNYAIRYACIDGHTEVVKMLLADERVDPTEWEKYAIGWARIYGHTEIVKLLEEYDRRLYDSRSVE